MSERVRDVVDAVRFLRQQPKAHPVEGLSLIGLELRRRNAGPFVVVYSYFEPSPSMPAGLVSVRAVRHPQIDYREILSDWEASAPSNEVMQAQLRAPAGKSRIAGSKAS